MEKAHRVRGVSAKKVVKKAAARSLKAKKKAPVKKAAVKKAAVKKAATKKVVKKAPAKKLPAKKAPVKKAPVKKSAPGRPFHSKSGKPTLTVDEKSQTVSVATVVAPIAAPVVEERRLVMPPPARPVKSGKKVAPLKPIKSAPTPVTAAAGEAPWSATELKAIRVEWQKNSQDSSMSWKLLKPRWKI